MDATSLVGWLVYQRVENPAKLKIELWFSPLARRASNQLLGVFHLAGPVCQSVALVQKTDKFDSLSEELTYISNDQGKLSFSEHQCQKSEN